MKSRRLTPCCSDTVDVLRSPANGLVIKTHTLSDHVGIRHEEVEKMQTWGRGKDGCGGQTENPNIGAPNRENAGREWSGFAACLHQGQRGATKLSRGLRRRGLGDDADDRLGVARANVQPPF